ncbi:hypothetical protein [Hymenobacter glaciei]|uniref:hypothetical protein n=1 Tax=Hymenobacter glaciei TaxID=877209 RepID=UPI0031F1C449
MNLTLLVCMFICLAGEPNRCLTLSIGRVDAAKHRAELVVTRSCKRNFVYKYSLEMQTSAGEWGQVLENVLHRVNPPYGYSTPYVSSQKRRETLVIAYPSTLPQQPPTRCFRIKAEYMAYGPTIPNPAPRHVLYTAAFHF